MCYVQHLIVFVLPISIWVHVILINVELISIICANRNNVACHTAAPCMLQSHVKLLLSGEFIYLLFILIFKFFFTQIKE